MGDRDQVVRGLGETALFEHGRQLMRRAFLELSDTARLMGMPEEFISTLHGQFFDGNVEVKDAMRALLELANAGDAQSGGDPAGGAADGTGVVPAGDGADDAAG